MQTRMILAGFALLASVACADESRVLVVFGTDYAIPGEVDAIGVTLFDNGGEQLETHQFRIAEPADVPFSFAVKPLEDGSEEDIVEVTFEGQREMGLVARTRRRFRFPSGDMRVLPVFLAKNCETLVCSDEETCSEQGCIDPFIEVTDLDTAEAEGDELDQIFSQCPTPTFTCVDRTSGRGCVEFGQPERDIQCGANEICSEEAGGCVDEASEDNVEFSIDVGPGGLVFTGPTPEDTDLIFCRNEGSGPVGKCVIQLLRGSPALELNATPEVGEIEFKGWAGDCAGFGACLLQADMDRTVNAAFGPIGGGGAMLRLELDQSSAPGRVIVVRQGRPPLLCAQSVCTFDLEPGEDVELFPQIDAGSRFGSWGGDCAGLEPQVPKCKLRMDTGRVVNASFDADACTRPLSARIEANGNLRTHPESRIRPDCGPECHECFLADYPVTYEPIPQPNYFFDGWGDDCVGFGHCALLPVAGNAATANFRSATAGQAQIGVVMIGIDNDTSDTQVNGGPGLGCWSNNGGTCWGEVPVGSGPHMLVVFDGDPDVRFDHWSGPCIGPPDAPECFVMPQSTETYVVRAHFVPANRNSDMTGDDQSELVLGVPGAGANRGAIQVIDPSFGPTSFRYDGLAAGDRTGQAGAFCGDWDRDGLSDYVVASPGAMPVDSLRIVSGTTFFPASGPISDASTTLLDGAPILPPEFGASLGVVPDLTNDRVPELLVGAPGALGVFDGAAYLLFGGFDANFQVGAPLAQFVGEGGGFGAKVVSIGDLDGRGVPEIAIGAPTNGTMNKGKIYIYSGEEVLKQSLGHGLSRVQFEPSDAVLIIEGRDRDFLGARIVGLGDFNDDGFDDFAFSTGLPLIGAATLFDGDVYVAFGGPQYASDPMGQQPLNNFIPQTASSPNGIRFAFRDAGPACFGYRIAGGYDLNSPGGAGDGIPDLVVSAPCYGGFDNGQVIVIAGAPSTETRENQLDNDGRLSRIIGDCGVNCSERLGHDLTIVDNVMGPVGPSAYLLVSSRWQEDGMAVRGRVLGFPVGELAPAPTPSFTAEVVIPDALDIIFPEAPR